jgi:hypothetical protein
MPIQLDRSAISSKNGAIMSSSRFALAASIFLALVAPAWAGHTLVPKEQKILTNWLAKHPNFRTATDKDCDCSEDIQQMKAGDGGIWRPVSDYHPYLATGDFNRDGIRDFAAVVIDKTKSAHQFTLLVFNGPFSSDAIDSTFVAPALDLKYMGLFFGPPRPKPYRLIVGRFESDNTSMLVPHGNTYKLK